MIKRRVLSSRMNGDNALHDVKTLAVRKYVALCTTCGGGDDEGTIRTCDCDSNYHCNAYCHTPPIVGPKQGDWLCVACE